jgi:hypothetical protein
VPFCIPNVPPYLSPQVFGLKKFPVVIKMGRPPKLPRCLDADGSEGGGNNCTGPLLSWSSGNRQHPWNLKRRASTNFVLAMPAIEESTYRLVLQRIQRTKRRQFNSKKRRYERIQQAEQLVRVAEQQLEVAASKVKLTREKLNDVKKARDQARETLQRNIQQKQKESTSKLEDQIQKLEQEIRSIKELNEDRKIPLVTDNFLKLHFDEDTKQSGDVNVERTKEAETSNMKESNNGNHAAEKLKDTEQSETEIVEVRDC